MKKNHINSSIKRKMETLKKMEHQPHFPWTSVTRKMIVSSIKALQAKLLRKK